MSRLHLEKDCSLADDSSNGVGAGSGKDNNNDETNGA